MPHQFLSGPPDLSSANLDGARLEDANLYRADLSGASLISADLSRANLYIAKLSGANLKDANLSGARMEATTLPKADLSGANLKEAQLIRANLFGVNLSGANLSGAKLDATDLPFVNFNGAHVGRTAFLDVDLSATEGLESVEHSGPSTIGIDTFYRSHGKIPDLFLRGAGVPETFITFAHSLVGQPIQFYSCFISYSTRDQSFADRLHGDLQHKGVRCWFAAHDIRGGKKIREQIDEAIRVYDRLLLILSEHSMNSEWVKTEIAHARQKEKEKNDGCQVLFPITLVPFDRILAWKNFDADTGKDTAREIREYYTPDFSNWKDHDSYQQAFQRLVRDLKSEPDTRRVGLR
jgi:hypothetical protein